MPEEQLQFFDFDCKRSNLPLETGCHMPLCPRTRYIALCFAGAVLSNLPWHSAGAFPRCPKYTISQIRIARCCFTAKGLKV